MKKLEGQKDTPKLGSILPVVSFLDPDEKAFVLVEQDRLTLDYKEKRRWQWILVLRDGMVAEWVADLGPAKGDPPFRIYSLWEDSVAELRHQADMQRGQNDLKQFILEKQQESQIINQALAVVHEKWERAHHRSILGPDFRKQRD